MVPVSSCIGYLSAESLARRQCVFSTGMHHDSGNQLVLSLPELQNLHEWTTALSIPLCKSLPMVENADHNHFRWHIVAAPDPSNARGFLGQSTSFYNELRISGGKNFIMIHQNHSFLQECIHFDGVSHMQDGSWLLTARDIFNRQSEYLNWNTQGPKRQLSPLLHVLGWVSFSKIFILNTQKRCFCNLKHLWDGKTVRHL